MTGKNKVERSFRVKFDDSSGAVQDISGDLLPGTFTGGGLIFDRAEMTGVSDAVKNFLAAHPMSELSGQFHLNDTATTGAHTVFISQIGVNGAAGLNTLTLEWGQSGAAPTTGDPDWEGEYILISMPLSMSGGKTIMTATWLPVTSAVPVWGTVT